MKRESLSKGKIVIYRTSKGPELEVRLEKETIWLTQKQIAELFGTQRPAITKHFNNIFKSGELKKNSVSSILEHTAPDGKKYKTQFYSLDAIISVGYRVNSKRATQFRIWATKTLKNYLINGYAINQKMLLDTREKFAGLQKTISFLQQKSKNDLLVGKEQEIIDLLSGYSKTLTLLEQYDTNTLKVVTGRKAVFMLEYNDVQKIIEGIKRKLLATKEASDLFGQEYQGKLESIVKNLYQTFDKKELYGSIEEKAAHLLYLVIKDHPFADGNKRIASVLFIYFLNKNSYLYRENGERKINDNALVALALLIAVSDPAEKEIMIKIIINLLK